MGKSSSTQEQRQEMTDNRAVLGEGAVQATTGAAVSITALDNGAINRAFDTTDTTVGQAFTFGGNALTEVATAARRVLDANTSNVNRVLDASAETANLVKDAYADAKGRGALTDKILIGTVLGALGVAALAVKRG